jgi:colanic acid biosynthesis glycosyl transferase WcaI
LKRRILFIGASFYPEPVGIGKYSGEMIKWLAEKGYSCTVITTFPSYPFWKVQPPYEKSSFWFKKETIPVKNGIPIKVIRCPHFVPRKPSGLTRLISDFTFFFNASLVVLLFLFVKKRHYLITVAPPFVLGLTGLLYRKIKGAKLLYHIQDLQIETARELKMMRSEVMIKILLSVEKFIINHADWVSTISTGMMERVKKKSNKPVLFFPNWVDTDSFYPLENKPILKQKFGFSSNDKVILYSGAIGQKQGLETVLDTAESLERFPEIKFAICGTGPYMEHLMKLRDEKKLRNVFFFNLQPVHLFNSFLNMADLHLVLQRVGASDLVLPSKLSTILSVGGVPIVTAKKGTSLYNIVHSGDLGIVIEPENPDALVDAITKENHMDLQSKSKKARLYAVESLGSNHILQNFFSKIFY